MDQCTRYGDKSWWATGSAQAVGHNIGEQAAVGVLTTLEQGADSKWTSALDAGTQAGGLLNLTGPWGLDVG
ncbi:MAG: hypothetical protein WD425_01455 [Nitrospirales bacterium]